MNAQGDYWETLHLKGLIWKAKRWIAVAKRLGNTVRNVRLERCGNLRAVADNVGFINECSRLRSFTNTELNDGGNPLNRKLLEEYRKMLEEKGIKECGADDGCGQVESMEEDLLWQD
ncbi:hypothetical protein HDV00_009630 [Rhizophlyctis rosea]|nr:hypothetical protein HDV00_009630 [Rhizophlyctis rosea]